MNAQMSAATAPARPWRSAGAVLAGFAAVVVLSIATDQVLHMLEVYPPWGQPMYATGLLLLALSYRLVYTLLGGYITARLAPRNALRHAVVLGVIGIVMGTLGAIAAWDFGPKWYPVALVLTALPCTWLGGSLYVRSTRP